MASTFAKSLADTAFDQHSKFHLMDETDAALCGQIKKYWNDLGFTFTSCSSVPWSAVFVSWCVKQAGATSTEFKFAAAHSVFVHDAINNPRAFKGFDIPSRKVEIGDIIQNNRNGTMHDFAFARANDQYASHSAIVVETGKDTGGKYALTIGGNEGDSIRQKRIQLTATGEVEQRPANPFICVLANLK